MVVFLLDTKLDIFKVILNDVEQQSFAFRSRAYVRTAKTSQKCHRETGAVVQNGEYIRTNKVFFTIQSSVLFNLLFANADKN